MGWLDAFKKKKQLLPDCLVCGKKIKGENFSEVKYRYGLDEGQVGTAHLCEKCSRYLDKKDDEDYGEPV